MSDTPIDSPDDIGSRAAATDTPPAAATTIDFLRSTTTTRVFRDSQGNVTETTVDHVARFGVNPGALPDMVHQYGSQLFRPQWAQVTWTDGRLTRIELRGQRVLKSGKLSESGHNTSRNYDWSGYDLENPSDRRVPPPEALMERIAAYQVAVSTQTGRS